MASTALYKLKYWNYISILDLIWFNVVVYEFKHCIILMHETEQ